MQVRLLLIGLLALVITACAHEAVTSPGNVLSTPANTSTMVHPSPLLTDNQPPTTTQSTADADVLFVRAVLDEDGTWTFYVTIQHPDTGWEDYADGWDILTPDGKVLKKNPDDPFTRLLLHPHVNEQPFTRSQSGIQVPDGVTLLQVRAHDIVDGYGGKEVEIDLTQPSGKDYQIER